MTKSESTFFFEKLNPLLNHWATNPLLGPGPITRRRIASGGVRVQASVRASPSGQELAHATQTQPLLSLCLPHPLFLPLPDLPQSDQTSRHLRLDRSRRGGGGDGAATGAPQIGRDLPRPQGPTPLPSPLYPRHFVLLDPLVGRFGIPHESWAWRAGVVAAVWESCGFEPRWEGAGSSCWFVAVFHYFSW